MPQWHAERVNYDRPRPPQRQDRSSLIPERRDHNYSKQIQTKISPHRGLAVVNLAKHGPKRVTTE